MLVVLKKPERRAILPVLIQMNRKGRGERNYKKTKS